MPNPKTETGHPAIYEIRIGGQLSTEWISWFDDLAVTVEERGESLIVGLVADQAALYGLLKKIRDLGIPLISVNLIQSQPKKE
jgi:hypothetical protein